ncbi:thioredoxin [Wolbachia endosymbiont of Pentidionis agamae]|uniref:thioredoxin n=1 Tax=Wolbachia endosymbiont of Pentidionis agamae TaxID=3110435 RepID=UPI002FD63C95
MNDKVIVINDKNFQSEVIEHDGFVLVDFWAEWCGPCIQLMPHVEEFAKSKKGIIKVCKFNVDEQELIPSEFAIQSIPTLIIFNNGKEIARKLGGIGSSDLSEWVEDEIS